MLWSGCKESARADYLGQAVRVQNFSRESLKTSNLWFYQSPGKHIMKSLNFQIAKKKNSKHFSGFYLKNWLYMSVGFFLLTPVISLLLLTSTKLEMLLSPIEICFSFLL